MEIFPSGDCNVYCFCAKALTQSSRSAERSVFFMLVKIYARKNSKKDELFLKKIAKNQFLQKLRESKVMSEKSSTLPSSINSMSTHLVPSGNKT